MMKAMEKTKQFSAEFACLRAFNKLLVQQIFLFYFLSHFEKFMFPSKQQLIILHFKCKTFSNMYE